MSDVAQILGQIEDGDQHAAEKLLPLVYDELRDPSQSQSSGRKDLGDVCGGSDGKPFVAAAGQTAQPLPVPRPTQQGSANDINNLGEIVGPTLEGAEPSDDRARVQRLSFDSPVQAGNLRTTANRL